MEDKPILTEQQIESLIPSIPDIPPIKRNPDGTFAKGSCGQRAMQDWSFNSWRRNMFEAFKRCVTKEDFEAVCKVLVKKAIKGDRECIKEIMNRCIGKETVNISVTSEDITWQFKFDMSKTDLEDQEIESKNIDCTILENESTET